MPRLTIQQTNFTAGEISPRLYGRTDIDRYASAAAEMVNCHPVIHGGAFRRGGTRFAKATKFGGTKRSRLVDFVFSKDQSFMLEFGEFYVRIFGPSGAYLTEIVSPYNEQQAHDLDYTQGADTMFLWHGAIFPQRLRRFADTVWDLSPAPFTVQPFDEQGHALAASLTLSATSGSVTMTASSGVFLPSDVGRNLVSSAGAGAVTGYTSANVLTVNVITPFPGTTLASGAWHLDLSPQAFAAPSALDPVGASITVVGAASRAASLTLSDKTVGTGRTVTASAGVFASTDVGKTFYADSGVASITGYGGPTQITINITTAFVSTTYSTSGWGITAPTFRPEDVGKFIRLNAGLLHITSLVDATTANATIITALTSIVVVPPLAWSLEGSVWSDANGYPRTGTLHEQRLWCAGSTKYPQTVWASKTALYLDFTKGTADSDACIFTIASDQINPISYLATARQIIVHTYGGEFSMQGGTDKPITPTNVQIKPQTSYGSRTVRPLTIGNESIFVQRAGRKVRALSYQLTIDGDVAPDITALAEHVTLYGVTSMAWQQEPYGMLWLTMGDGTLASCTLDRAQNVTGWARHITDGAFEWVASIPIGDTEQLWAIVRRTVGGVVQRYVEFFDIDFAPMLPGAAVAAYPPLLAPVVYGTTTDCSIQVDNAGGQTVFTGLGYLEGKTVDVVADGSPMTPAVVTGGTITLPRAAKRTLIGLHFDSWVLMLTPEVGTGTGTAQGNSMRTSEITLRFLNTLGATVLDGGGRAQPLAFRHLGPGVLDQPPPVYSGEMRLEALGWDRGRAALKIMQTQPLPMQLESVIRKFTVND